MLFPLSSLFQHQMLVKPCSSYHQRKADKTPGQSSQHYQVFTCINAFSLERLHIFLHFILSSPATSPQSSLLSRTTSKLTFPKMSGKDKVVGLMCWYPTSLTQTQIPERDFPRADSFLLVQQPHVTQSSAEVGQAEVWADTGSRAYSQLLCSCSNSTLNQEQCLCEGQVWRHWCSASAFLHKLSLPRLDVFSVCWQCPGKPCWQIC